MSLIKKLQAHRKELSASSLFPATHLVSKGVFATQNQQLGVTLSLEGASFITEMPTKLNELSNTLHQAIKSLDTRFIVYVTSHRRISKTSLDGRFKSTFATKADKKYQSRFDSKNLYKNDLYLTVLLHSVTVSSLKKNSSLVESIKSSLSLKKQSVYIADEVNKSASLLMEKVAQLITLLGPFKPRLLEQSDLMRFLSLIPNAGELPHFAQSTRFPITARATGQIKAQNDKYPHGHMGVYLCNKRLMFGRHIQFQGAASTDTRYGAMLSLKKYPTETGSVILDPLLNLDSEYISTHCFIPTSQDNALRQVKQKRNKLINADDLAFSQQDDLSDLEDDLATESAVLGMHQHTLMLLSDTIEELEDRIRKAVKQYGYCGVGVIKETIGMEASFWSQIPGNSHLQTRAALITSRNFCDFCSLHNYQNGYINQNHLGGALTLFESPSRTPIYFNLHTKGSKTNPSKGHTLIIGGNGSGKNVLASHLDMQLGRYNNRSFFLERNQASKIYVLASGNSEYYVISPDNTGNLSLNPFRLPDTPSNRAFLKDWLSQLVLRPGESHLVGRVTEDINDCVDYAFEQLKPEQRKLSNVSKILPVDFSRWPELRAWLNETEEYGAGQLAWIFDNDDDSMSMNLDKVGFDVTYLMDSVSEHVSTPVYMYLLHRMRQTLEGTDIGKHRLTTIVIDEFWQVLKSPYWNSLLEDWLPTIRKQNAHFVFMTQSADTVVHSNISRQVLENLSSLLLFGAPQAKATDYINGLGLTEPEFDFVKNNSPDSRSFLFKQDMESMICRFDISDMSEEIRVYSANQQSVNLLNQIIKEKGKDPESWLDEFLRRSAA